MHLRQAELSAGPQVGCEAELRGFVFLSVHLQEEDIQMKNSPEMSQVATIVPPTNIWQELPTLVACLHFIGLYSREGFPSLGR